MNIAETGVRTVILKALEDLAKVSGAAVVNENSENKGVKESLVMNTVYSHYNINFIDSKSAITELESNGLVTVFPINNSSDRNIVFISHIDNNNSEEVRERLMSLFR